MTTIPEAMAQLVRKVEAKDPGTLASYDELIKEPEILATVLAIADSPGEGLNAKLLRAFTLGVMVGIVSEKGDYNASA